MADRWTELETALNYSFRDRRHLESALIHPSAGGAAIAGGQAFERLEFLGDRVLGLVAADLLLAGWPDADEGELSRRHVSLVRGDAVAAMARDIDIGAWLVVDSGTDESGGRGSDSILADTMEAVIGALYLDGGLAAASGFLTPRLRRLARETPVARRDAKTALQEWAQARGHALPRYDIVERDGPPHRPTFRVRVVVPDIGPDTNTPGAAEGEGASRRAAEQGAAARLLEQLRRSDGAS
ncbi:MAG: ribonuclease III [Alphaproteobacteria bacterium]